MTEWVGVHVDAITPRGKQGDVDIGAAFELVDFLCAAGVRGIVLFGATGEYPAFHSEERSRLIYMAAKRSRVPVIAGAGSASFDQSLDLARAARDAGAAAILLPPPFCVHYEAEDVREFYLQFANHLGSSVPTFLSHAPAMTSVIPLDVADQLLSTGLFAGIADTSGDFESLYGSRFPVIAANDRQLARARGAGCRGILSAAACAVPELVVALDRAIDRGNSVRAQQLDAALHEFDCWTRRFPAPVAIKVATSLRGPKTAGSTGPLSDAKQKRLDEFRAWFKDWLPAVRKLSADA